jgi:voltage-gated potassium channel
MMNRTTGPERKLKYVASFMVAVMLVGVIGYMVVEKANFLDALYMTVITLTTVGFREVITLDEPGKVFTILLLITGVGSIFYAASLVIQMFLEGQIGSLIYRRKMERSMIKLKDHYIVAGYGRVGQTVCREFNRWGKDLVVIENNEESEAVLKQNEKHFIIGDATQDDTLELANIKHAAALVSTLADEAHNVYLTLSARQANSNLCIISRADSKDAEIKLYRAGASRVICPHELGGMRMALATMRPNLIDFMQVGQTGNESKLAIEEVVVKHGSRLAGVALRDSGIRNELDLMVVGIKKEGQEMLPNPPASTMIDGGDTMVVIGDNQNLAKLDEYVGTRRD